MKPHEEFGLTPSPTCPLGQGARLAAAVACPLAGTILGYAAPLASDLVDLNVFSAAKALVALCLLGAYAKLTAASSKHQFLVVAGILGPLLTWSLPDPKLLFCLFSLTPTFLLLSSRESTLAGSIDGWMLGLCAWLGPGSWILDDLTVSMALNAAGGTLWMCAWALAFSLLAATRGGKLLLRASLVVGTVEFIRTNDYFPVPYFAISRLFPSSAFTYLPEWMLNPLSRHEWVLGLTVCLLSLFLVRVIQNWKLKSQAVWALLPVMALPIPTFPTATLDPVFALSLCAGIQPDRLNTPEKGLVKELQHLVKQSGDNCGVIVAPSYSRVSYGSAATLTEGQTGAFSLNTGNGEKMVVFGDVVKTPDRERRGVTVTNAACALPRDRLLLSERAPCSDVVKKTYAVPLVEKPLPAILSVFEEDKDDKPLGFERSKPNRLLHVGALKAAVGICWEASIPGIFSSVAQNSWRDIDLVIFMSDLSTLGPSVIEAWQAEKNMRFISRIHRKPGIYVGVYNAFAVSSAGELLPSARVSSQVSRW